MKLVNKNRVLIKINKTDFIVIDRIVIPKFYINGNEFTEYDMRNLQLEVCKGNVSHIVLNGMDIKDEQGQKFEFREDGCLINSPNGYKLMTNMTLDMLSIRNKKQNNK